MGGRRIVGVVRNEPVCTDDEECADIRQFMQPVPQSCAKLWIVVGHKRLRLQFLGDTGETNLYGLERPFGLLSQYTHQRLAGSLGVGSGGLVASPDLEPEDQDDRERKYCRSHQAAKDTRCRRP